MRKALGLALVALAAACAWWFWKGDRPKGPDRGDAVAPVEADLPPLPKEIPEYLPVHTEFQKRFVRVREEYITNPRRTLEQGSAGRMLKGAPDESVELLKASALRDPHDRFRAWSVTLLGDLKRPDLAEEVFVPRLLEDRFFGVRVAAATALGKLGLRDHLGALRRAAGSDPDEAVRRQAERSIQEISDKEVP